jgi:hypothetical protein
MTLHRQIDNQFQGKRKIHFVAADHEVSHGRDITWKSRVKEALEHITEAWIGSSGIVEVTASDTPDSKPFRGTHLFLNTLRTTPEDVLQLVRDQWSIEGLHWILNTQLPEAAQSYRGDRTGETARLRTAAMNLLRLIGFQSDRVPAASISPNLGIN